LVDGVRALLVLAEVQQCLLGIVVHDGDFRQSFAGCLLGINGAALQ